MSVMTEVLGELAKIPGVNGAVVVSRDGFVIEGAAATEGVDLEAVGAVVSAGIGASEVMGQELNVGSLAQSMIEYANGFIVVTLLGDAAVLAIVAELSAHLGNIRHQVKKHTTSLVQAL